MRDVGSSTATMHTHCAWNGCSRPPSCRGLAGPICSLSPGPARVSRMDPAVLIFLLYVMIAHELFCGWMHYRRQRTKYRKAAGPVLRSSGWVDPRSCRVSKHVIPAARGGRDLRKCGHIIRKA